MTEQNTPEYWRVRAAEAQAIGDQLSDVGCKQVMYSIAAGYEQMAVVAQRYERAEATARSEGVTHIMPRTMGRDRRLN
jgi:hypothetical protein